MWKFEELSRCKDSIDCGLEYYRTRCSNLKWWEGSRVYIHCIHSLNVSHTAWLIIFHSGSAAKPFGIPQPRILQSQNRAFSKSLYTIDTSDYIDGYDSGYSGSGSSSNSVSSIGHNWRRQELSPVHGELGCSA